MKRNAVILNQAVEGSFYSQNFRSVQNFTNVLRVVVENWRGRSWHVEVLDISPYKIMIFLKLVIQCKSFWSSF